MYVEVIFWFHSILRLKTYVEGTYALNLLLPHAFFPYRENATKCTSVNCCGCLENEDPRKRRPKSQDLENEDPP